MCYAFYMQPCSSIYVYYMYRYIYICIWCVYVITWLRPLYIFIFAAWLECFCCPHVGISCLYTDWWIKPIYILLLRHSLFILLSCCLNFISYIQCPAIVKCDICRRVEELIELYYTRISTLYLYNRTVDDSLLFYMWWWARGHSAGPSCFLVTSCLVPLCNSSSNWKTVKLLPSSNELADCISNLCIMHIINVMYVPI